MARAYNEVLDMKALVGETIGYGEISFIHSFGGYNHIKMSIEDINEPHFQDGLENFYYVVMPFGLKGLKATHPLLM